MLRNLKPFTSPKTSFPTRRFTKSANLIRRYSYARSSRKLCPRTVYLWDEALKALREGVAIHLQPSLSKLLPAHSKGNRGPGDPGLATPLEEIKAIAPMRGDS